MIPNALIGCDIETRLVTPQQITPEREGSKGYAGVRLHSEG